ncbi:MAG TPA: translational GTPase TypA [Candidatus Hydrogenedentes bacterium]|nr:translational GTPase TypA [Candidatus Hydrogenedentota bacterium]
MHPISSIRNVAIIAHIDHGKTTLIDSIFRAAHMFRENARVAQRFMDNNELERERGITIRSKHCTVEWKNYLINIIDTPGHADFSGEVERVLSMVDSVLLLVDANEGPMPQTRYVLMRALRLGLRPIVIINKVDRPNAEPLRALDATFDLFLTLGATEEQCDFITLYGSGLNGWLSRNPEGSPEEGMEALFETIVTHVPPPKGKEDAPFLMQVNAIGWNEHIGRTGTGRILQGRLTKGMEITRWTTKRKEVKRLALDTDTFEWSVTGSSQEKAVYLWATQGLSTVSIHEVGTGDIVTLAGPKELNIGDTLAAVELENPALPPLDIEEPTVSMMFLINSGPFSGREGKAVTQRQLKERLMREIRVNVSLRVEDTGRMDALKVSGRGELHLSILIEEMRREGMEFCVSAPEVIIQTTEEGSILEPVEEVVIDVMREHQGIVIEKVSERKGELLSMQIGTGEMIRMEFRVPTRGLIGYRGEFLTDTRGLGIMASRFSGYALWYGNIPGRNRGSMVSMDTGYATGYSLENLQQRGTLFISPMTEVYTGMIIGENARPGDLPCNPTKRKQLTNHRSATKEQTVTFDVPRTLSLEEALEWIGKDELVEITPSAIRLRKTVLDFEERKKIERHLSAVEG